MPFEPTVDELRNSLKQRLEYARATTDALFAMLDPRVLTERPIPERHRIVFYLGHFEAFDWNLIARTTLGLNSFDSYFDDLFAFGIDPVGIGLPTDSPADWPDVSQITRYSHRVRQTVDAILNTTDFSNADDLSNGLIFNVAIEHRLMHAETLAYMLHWLDLAHKRPPAPQTFLTSTKRRILKQVEIPQGQATLGRSRKHQGFGWDNEFGEVSTAVPRFLIDACNVTNGQFLEFLRSGGYQDRAFWTAADWEWKSANGIGHPRFWMRHGDHWMLRNMFDLRPLPLSWPVYVSHAEARAYTRWAGRSLPSEAQLHRAAYGSHDGNERPYPWGMQTPSNRHGNFDFVRWDPSPVGSYPAGDSAFGVSDLVGNGWEWTATPFEPFEGFERFHFYPGYSANFFDGKHFVMKGGSARTSACMLRRSFRNWFQPHYPNVYATFRCVES